MNTITETFSRQQQTKFENCDRTCALRLGNVFQLFAPELLSLVMMEKRLASQGCHEDENEIMFVKLSACLERRHLNADCNY